MLELWQQTYQGELLILLPDTFGTTQFLRDAPDWVADWTGQRIDSKDPFVAGDEYIAWLEERGRDPRRKRLIASDALDVDKILALHAYFGGRVREGSAAWRIFAAAGDFLPRGEMDSAPAHPLFQRLGHVPDQRFPQLQSARRRRASIPSAWYAS